MTVLYFLPRAWRAAFSTRGFLVAWTQCRHLLFTCSLLVLAAGGARGQAAGSFDTGDNHSLSIHADGTLWAWGNNQNGQLGDGTTTTRSSPVQVGTATNWKSVSAGFYYSLAIRTDGTLWSWGTNFVSQLGDGTTMPRTSPGQIGTATNWESVSAGYYHSLAVRTDGTLWAWGDNGNGQLGDGTTGSQSNPAQLGTATSWRSVSAGQSHSLALSTNGTLWAWGANYSGQVGDGGSAYQLFSPVQVGTATWQNISAGANHSLAVRTDGTLWAWGANYSGQVGDGSSTYQVFSPVQVGTATNWQSVSGAYGHSLAIRTDGTLWAWGENGNGQVGSGSSAYQVRSPVQVGTATNWRTASAGSVHSLAVRADGTLWAWGDNFQAQLGFELGSSVQNSKPTQIGTAVTWRSVSAGSRYSLAVRTDGTLWAWGDNNNGPPLITNTGGNNSGPVFSPQQIGTATTWQSVSVGAGHSLALRTDGTLWAWGANYLGQVGDGSNAYHVFSPVQVGTATNWQSISAGYDHSLAIRTDGTLWAWGSNQLGQLGDSTTSQHASLVRVGTAMNWQSVSGGLYHTLAIQADGSLWAWGGNFAGQLGTGSNAYQELSPVQVGTALTWQRVSASLTHSLAVRTDGTLWGWGDNNTGQLGDGGNSPQALSPQQIGTSTTWRSVSAGQSHSLAMRTDGTLWAWGFNGGGQLGSGTRAYQVYSVAQVGTASTWQSADAGSSYTLALRTDGTLWAWGENYSGQLGYPSYFTEPQLAGAGGTGALPVELTAFSATAEGPAARLRWRTASEKNNHHFQVQRSFDGSTFEAIGDVAGQGSKASATSYAYLDDQLTSSPLPHLTYYRLRQVDLNGTFSYSPVRAVSLPSSAAQQLTVYPNPARAAATVSGLPAGAPLELRDHLGRTVARATADASGSARLALPASLPAGVYVLRSGAQYQRLLVE